MKTTFQPCSWAFRVWFLFRLYSNQIFVIRLTSLQMFCMFDSLTLRIVIFDNFWISGREILFSWPLCTIKNCSCLVCKFKIGVCCIHFCCRKLTDCSFFPAQVWPSPCWTPTCHLKGPWSKGNLRQKRIGKMLTYPEKLAFNTPTCASYSGRIHKRKISKNLQTLLLLFFDKER